LTFPLSFSWNTLLFSFPFDGGTFPPPFFLPKPFIFSQHDYPSSLGSTPPPAPHLFYPQAGPGQFPFCSAGKNAKNHFLPLNPGPSFHVQASYLAGLLWSTEDGGAIIEFLSSMKRSLTFLLQKIVTRRAPFFLFSLAPTFFAALLKTILRWVVIHIAFFRPPTARPLQFAFSSNRWERFPFFPPLLSCVPSPGLESSSKVYYQICLLVLLPSGSLHRTNPFPSNGAGPSFFSLQ